MIDVETAAAVVSLLSNDRDQLRSIQRAFHVTVNAVSRVAAIPAITALLECGLLSPCQQVVALWMIDRETRSPHMATDSTKTKDKLQFSPLIIAQCNGNPIIRLICAAVAEGDHTAIDGLAGKTVAQILSGKVAFKTTAIPKEFDPEDILETRSLPVFVVEENNKAPEYTDTSALVKLLSSGALFNEAKTGADFEAPPLFGFSEEEFSYSYVQTQHAFPIFDDGERRMIYEPIESIIGRMDKDILKERECNIVIDAVKDNKELVNFMFDESQDAIKRAQRFIRTNLECAKSLYIYLAAIDGRVFDVIINFEINRYTLEIIECVVLNDPFPSNFVESFIDSALERIRSTEDREKSEMCVSDLCRMMCNMHFNKVQFSDYVTCELRDLCEESSFIDIPESQNLLALIGDE